MKLKIRGKIVGLFLASLLCISVLMIFVMSKESKEAVENAVLLNVQTTMNMSVKYTEEKLAMYEQVLQELAADEAFTGSRIDIDRAAALIEDFAERNNFDRVNYTDENGINGAGLDFSEREYFIRCKETKEPVISDIYESKTVEGEYSILFAAPIIRKNGEFGGIVYTATKATLLSEAIADIAVGESSSAFILDRTGAVIAAQEEEMLQGRCNFIEGLNTSKSFKTEQMAAISKKMIAGETGYDLLKLDAKTAYFSVYMPICPENGWSICISGNMRDYMESFYRGVELVIFVTVIVFILLSILVMFFVSRLTKPIVLSTNRMKSLSEGDLHSVMPVVKSNDETSILSNSIAGTIDTLNHMISEVSDTLGKMSDGDFTIRVEQEFKGDLLPLKEALNQILQQLRKLLTEISYASGQVLFGSQNVAQLSEALAATVTEQTSIMEQIRENVVTISNGANVNAESAHSAAKLAQEAMESVETGSRNMEELIEAMHKMEKSSQAIEVVNKSVSDIAFQTNILALNASVEAARAGEAGRGFAVVAEEVRTLAEKSSALAENASELIEETVVSVGDGMEIAQRTAEAMHDVVVRTKTVDETIGKIAQMSQEQLENLEFIMTSIKEIADALTTTAASSEESSATAQELQDQATALEELVKRFKV